MLGLKKIEQNKLQNYRVPRENSRFGLCINVGTFPFYFANTSLTTGRMHACTNKAHRCIGAPGGYKPKIQVPITVYIKLKDTLYIK